MQTHEFPVTQNFGSSFFFGFWVLIGVGFLLSKEKPMIPCGLGIALVGGYFFYRNSTWIWKWKQTVQITSESVIVDGREILFASIKNVATNWVRTKYRLNFIPTGDAEEVRIRITENNGSETILFLDESTGFHHFNRDLKGSLKEMRVLGEFLCERTEQARTIGRKR